MFPDATDIATHLSPLLTGKGELWCQDGAILLVPAHHGWVTRLHVTPDLVRVFTGLGVRISIGADEPTDVGAVIEVVAAIMDGDIEEYFGPGDDGPLSSIEHHVWYHGGRRVTPGVAASAMVRAPKWS